MSDLTIAAESPSRSPLALEVARRRTFAIISHPDAGKTTLTEKLLLFGGAINLAGQVKAKKDRRSTRSDWMSIERERGISVVTSVMTFEYGDCVFDLLDKIEKVLALDTAPVNWPVGRGRDFIGTIDIESGGVRLLDGDAGKTGPLRQMSVPDVAALNKNLDANALAEELALVHDG